MKGKGVQKKPNMFTAGSSTSATFILPVYVYSVIHICIYIYTIFENICVK